MAVEIPGIKGRDLAYITERSSYVVKNIFTFLVGDKATHLALDRIWTPVKDLGACAGVNRKWRALASESDLWERVVSSHFHSVDPGAGVMGRCLARLDAIQTNLKTSDKKQVPITNFLLSQYASNDVNFVDGNVHLFVTIDETLIQVRHLDTKAVLHFFNFSAFNGRLSGLRQFFMTQDKLVTVAKDENNKYCFLVWDLNAPEKFRSVSFPEFEGIPELCFVEDKIICAKPIAPEVFYIFFLRDEKIQEYRLSEGFRNHAQKHQRIFALGGLKNLIFISLSGNRSEIFDLSTGISKGVEESSYREILPMGDRWLLHTVEFERSDGSEVWSSFNDVLEVRDEGLSSDHVYATSREKVSTRRTAGKCFVQGKNILRASADVLKIYSTDKMQLISSHLVGDSLKKQFFDGKLYVLEGTLLSFDFSQMVPLEVRPDCPIQLAPILPPPVLQPAQPIDLAPVLPPPVEPIDLAPQDEPAAEDFFAILRERISGFFDWLWHSIRNCLGY